MTATTELKAGDVVILVRKYGDRPVTSNVDKVTPKGSVGGGSLPVP